MFKVRKFDFRNQKSTNNKQDIVISKTTEGTKKSSSTKNLGIAQELKSRPFASDTIRKKK